MSDIKQITEKVAFLTDHLVELRAPRIAQKERDSEKEELERWKTQQDNAYRAAAPTDQKVIGPTEKKVIQVDAPEEDDDSSKSSRRSDVSDSSSSRISDVTDIDPDDWNSDLWYDKVRRLFEKLQNKQEWDMMVSLRKQFDSRSAERTAGLEHIQNLDDDRRKEADRFKHAQSRFDKDMEDSQVHIFTTLNNFNTSLHTSVDSIRQARERRVRKKKNSGLRFSFSNMRKTRKILWEDTDGDPNAFGDDLGEDLGDGGDQKKSAAGDMLRVISGQQNQIASLKTTAFMAEKRVALHQNCLLHLEKMQNDPDGYLEAPEEIQNILLDMMMRRESGLPPGSISGSRFMPDSELQSAEFLNASESPAGKGKSTKRADDLQLNIEINELKRKVREVQEGMDQVVPKHKRHLTQRKTVQEEMERVMNKTSTSRPGDDRPAGAGEGSMVVARRGRAAGSQTAAAQGQSKQPDSHRKNSTGEQEKADLPLHERFTKMQLRVNQGQLTLQRGNEERNLFYESLRKAEQWRSRSMNREISPPQKAQKPEVKKTVAIAETQEVADTATSDEQQKREKERQDELEIKRAALALASSQKEVLMETLMTAKNNWREVSGIYMGNMGKPAPADLQEGEEILQDLSHQTRNLRGAIRVLNARGNEMLKAHNMPAMQLPEAAVAQPEDPPDPVPIVSGDAKGSKKTQISKAAAPAAEPAADQAADGRQRRAATDRSESVKPETQVPGSRGNRNDKQSEAGASGKIKGAPAAAPAAATTGRGKAAEDGAAQSGNSGGRAASKQAARGRAAPSDEASDTAVRRSPRNTAADAGGKSEAAGGRRPPSEANSPSARNESGSGRAASDVNEAASGSTSPVSRTASPTSSSAKPTSGAATAVQTQASGNASNTKPPATESKGHSSDFSGDVRSSPPVSEGTSPGSRQPSKSRTQEQSPAPATAAAVEAGEQEVRAKGGPKNLHIETDIPDSSSATDAEDDTSSKADKHTHFDLDDGEQLPAGFTLAQDGKPRRDEMNAAKMAKMKSAAKEIVKMSKAVKEGAGVRGQEGSCELQGPPDMISRLLGIQRENIEITEQIKVYKDMMSNAKKTGALSNKDAARLEDMNKQENTEMQDEMQQELAELRMKVRKLQRRLKLMRQQWQKLEQWNIKVPSTVRRGTFVDKDKRPSLSALRQGELDQPMDESGRNSSNESTSRDGSKSLSAGARRKSSPELHPVTLEMDPNAPPGDHAGKHAARDNADGQNASQVYPPGHPLHAWRREHREGDDPAGAEGQNNAQASQNQAGTRGSAQGPTMPWARRGSTVGVTRNSVLNHLASPRATMASVRRSLNALANASRRASNEINEMTSSLEGVEVSASPASPAQKLSRSSLMPDQLSPRMASMLQAQHSVPAEAKPFPTKRGSMLPGQLLEGRLSSMFQFDEAEGGAEGLSVLGSISGKSLQSGGNKRLSALDRSEASRHTIMHTDFLEDPSETIEEEDAEKGGDLLVTNAKSNKEEPREKLSRIFRGRAQTVVARRARSSRFGHNPGYMQWQRLKQMQSVSRSLFIKPTDAAGLSNFIQSSSANASADASAGSSSPRMSNTVMAAAKAFARRSTITGMQRPLPEVGNSSPFGSEGSGKP